MRDEIREPLSWRTNIRNHAEKVSRSARKARSKFGHALRADLVDAAFAEETVTFPDANGSHRMHRSHRVGTTSSSPSQSELVRNLHDQLALLDSQREQIQHLLDAADDSSR